MAGFEAHDAPMTDPRPAFQKAAEIATGVIDGIRPDQLTKPTPTDYDVAGLVDHLAEVAVRAAEVGRVGDPMAVDVTGAEWHTAIAGTIAAWADGVALDQPTKIPWAPESGRQALMAWVMELTVHAWDLARATGQAPVWDDDVCRLALTCVLKDYPRTGRRELFESTVGAVPFEDAVDVPAGAPLVDQVVSMAGRDPRWPATS